MTKLDPRTVDAIDSLFEGRVCCKCGKPARRIRVGKFLCHSCSTSNTPKTAIQLDEYTTPFHVLTEE